MYRGMSWEAMRVRSIHLRETEITDMAAKHFETFRQPEILKYIAAKHFQIFCLPEIHKYMAADHCKGQKYKGFFLFLLRIVLSPKHTGVILPGPIWINPVT